MRSCTYMGILEEKLTILNRICGNVEIDRSSIEDCIRAIAKNTEEFKALIEIESRLDEMISEETVEVREVLEAARNALLAAREGTAVLLESISQEKEMAAKNLGAFSKVNAVRNSYVEMGNTPLFVDKDFR